MDERSHLLDEVVEMPHVLVFFGSDSDMALLKRENERCCSKAALTEWSFSMCLPTSFMVAECEEPCGAHYVRLGTFLSGLSSRPTSDHGRQRRIVSL